jgi:hypothetical protein
MPTYAVVPRQPRQLRATEQKQTGGDEEPGIREALIHETMPVLVPILLVLHRMAPRFVHRFIPVVTHSTSRTAETRDSFDPLALLIYTILPPWIDTTLEYREAQAGGISRYEEAFLHGKGVES